MGKLIRDGVRLTVVPALASPAAPVTTRPPIASTRQQLEMTLPEGMSLLLKEFVSGLADRAPP